MLRLYKLLSSCKLSIFAKQSSSQTEGEGSCRLLSSCKLSIFAKQSSSQTEGEGSCRLLSSCKLSIFAKRVAMSLRTCAVVGCFQVVN